MLQCSLSSSVFLLMLILVLQSGCNFGSHVLLLPRHSFDDCCCVQFAKSSWPGLAKLKFKNRQDLSAWNMYSTGFIAVKLICSLLTLCLDLLETSSWEGAFSQDFCKRDNMHNTQYWLEMEQRVNSYLRCKKVHCLIQTWLHYMIRLLSSFRLLDFVRWKC